MVAASSSTFRLTFTTIPLFGTNLECEDMIVLDIALFSTTLDGGVDGNGGKSSSSRPGGFGCSGAMFRLKEDSGKGFLL